MENLIGCEQLVSLLEDPDLRVVDCRFSLKDPQEGRRDFEKGHIPGALYGDLNRQLSSAVVPGKTGRHPLPEIQTIAAVLSAWGIDASTRVVAYDHMGGAVASRLWWLLRWLGHRDAAVLDGGWAEWQKRVYPISRDEAQPVKREFKPRPIENFFVNTDEVARLCADPEYLVLDARASVRYSGEEEPIDPVSGHIPGAVSAPFTENLNETGCFKSPESLRRRFEPLLGGIAPRNVVVYCGSGVTANHNLLAMVHAGLEGARLYPGSWSEWIVDPRRPVIKGKHPR